MSITFVRDATHRNINSIPAGMMAALYTTGSQDIKATPDDFVKHPNAVRICQDHGSDITADILDVEEFAATPQDAVKWVPQARHSFATNKRPGQRWPGIYTNRVGLTPVANAMVKTGLSGVPLWIAIPGMPQSDAIKAINDASGPFPIIALQIRFETVTDLSVFSDEWLNHRSGEMTVNATVPPGQWDNPDFWEWKDAIITGIGLDNRLHTFTFNPGTGIWTKID